MTTTVTPDIKQDHPERQEWPTLAPDLADTTREDRADWFDPTLGRTIGSEPYDDPTQTQARLRPLRRPHPGTQARLRPRRRPHPSR